MSSTRTHRRRPNHGWLGASLATGALVLGATACGATSPAATKAAPAAGHAPASVPAVAAPVAPAASAAPGTGAAPAVGAQPVAAPLKVNKSKGHKGAPVNNAITITSPGMSYVVKGHLHPGVAAITWKNTDDEAHMMAVSRLKPGVTLDQVKAALNKSEEAATGLLADGPDAAYGTPAPLGAGQSTTVTAPNLKAGNYVLVCFFNGKNGMPHFMMGMINELTVKGGAQSTVPASNGTITITDNGFGLPKNFTGHGTYLVKDIGQKPHNLSFARLDKGTSLASYVGYVGQAMNSGTPVDGGGGVLDGGIDVLAPGGSAWLTLDLKPGHYGYVSTEDITGPGLPAQHGEVDIR